MNDYFAAGLAHERQADYLREVEHDELVAQVHPVDRPSYAPVPDRSTGGSAGRLLITALAAVALVLALAAPVAADNASYPGCSNFGAVQTGDVAPHGVLGAVIKSIAPTGPGVLSGIVQEEYGVFCAPH
jgi:hypothetical protein